MSFSGPAITIICMTGDSILVTGATGFIGRHLVSALAAADADVTVALRRHGAFAPRPRTHAVTIEEIGPSTDWAEALEGARAVVHLAGLAHNAAERGSPEDRLFDHVNHLGSAGLFKAAADRGTPLFVHISSITVLGDRTLPGAPFDDRALPDPKTPYARSKLAAEETLRRLAAGGATRLVILRPPLVCGPGVKANLASLMRLASSPLPLPLGGVDNRRTLLSIENLVSAIQAVLARGGEAPSGVYALGDPEPVSTGRIVREMRAGLGRSPRLFRPPEAVVRRLLDSGRLGGLPQRLFGNLEVDSGAFRTTFGWTDAIDTSASLRAMARSRIQQAAENHV